MLGFGLTSAVMCVAQGLVRAALARRGGGLAAAVRPADGGGQPAGPADPVQRHLPGLRPGAEVAAVRQLPALHAAVPGRRLLPRHRVPQGAADLRPRLFRRPHRLRPVRAAVPAARCTSSRPTNLLDRAARCCGSPAACCGSWRWDSRRPIAGLAAMAVVCVGVHLAAAGRSTCPTLAVSDYKGVVLRAQVPRQRARLRARLAVRLSRGLLQLLPAFRAGPLRQRRLQPAEHAGQRLSRHVHRRRRPERHHPRPAARRDRLFPLPADDLPVPDQAGARHLRRAVRRRHLDRGGAARAAPSSVTVAEGNPAVLGAFRNDKGLRDFTGDILNNPKIKVIDYDGRLYLAYTKRPLRHHRPEPCRLGRPVEPRRLRHRREVRLHARGHGELHARAQGRRHPLGDAVEQGGAAEVGAQALRHHGGGGARARRRRHRRQLLRRVELSVDRDRALQARRLHAGGDRQSCATTRARCRSTRSTIRASPTTPRRPRRCSSDYRNQIFSDGPSREDRAPTPADAPKAGEGSAARRRRCCRRPPWASWPGTIWCTAAGTTSPSATCSTRARSPTTGPTSPPT